MQGRAFGRFLASGFTFQYLSRVSASDLRGVGFEGFRI